MDNKEFGGKPVMRGVRTSHSNCVFLVDHVWRWTPSLNASHTKTTFCVCLVYSRLRVYMRSSTLPNPNHSSSSLVFPCEMRTKSKITQPLPPRSPRRSTFAKISLPGRLNRARAPRRNNARHSSHKDGKTVQSLIKTATDAAASSSATTNVTNDQSCDLVERDTDMGMAENDSEDHFSLSSKSDDDGEDSDYVLESDDSEDENEEASRQKTHTYFLRKPLQRKAELRGSTVTNKTYNTRSKARQAAS